MEKEGLSLKRKALFRTWKQNKLIFSDIGYHKNWGSNHKIWALFTLAKHIYLCFAFISHWFNGLEVATFSNQLFTVEDQAEMVFTS